MTTPVTISRWDEPEGASPRGTLIVIAGRGETSTVYTRLARRLSADAYRVRVVSDPTPGEIDAAQLIRSLVEESSARPVILVGSDSGSIYALRAAAAADTPVAAVITAGLPVGSVTISRGLDPFVVRSACPVHRKILEDAEVLDPHAYEQAMPADLVLPAAGELSGVRVLGIHGENDQIANIDNARDYYESLAESSFSSVTDGRHDILNDVTHRSVAAAIVLFLGQVRNGGAPILRYHGVSAPTP